MPELPEVETIKKDLLPFLIGKTFTTINVYWPRMALEPSFDEFCRQIPGQKVEEISRRGKYLVMHLSSGQALVFHMRMTGSLLYMQDFDSINKGIKYITAAFGLDSGAHLLFCDRRKLGTIALVDNTNKLENKLGPEPLDSNFTSEAFKSRLKARKASIKAILCDQKVIAGIGNMYADESLFTARIHPLRPAENLSEAEMEQLHQAIQEVLLRGIANAGASFSDYCRPNGEPGIQQDSFMVAHRGGEPCHVCTTPIVRIPIRNRGTYFCPNCQV